MSSHQPHLWVFAGPNGAGKSTLMRLYKVAERFPVVNTDDIARELRPYHLNESETAVLVHAGREAIQLRTRLLNENLSFAIETTLTGHSELHLMRAAKKRGYIVNLIYVMISHAEQSNSRVTTRTKLGGHDVPEPEIFRRFNRSLQNLPTAIKACDRVQIFENSTRHYNFVIGGESSEVIAWLHAR